MVIKTNKKKHPFIENISLTLKIDLARVNSYLLE